MAEETKTEAAIFGYIRSNPLKAAAGVLTLLGIMVSTVWAADARFNQTPQINELKNAIQFDRRQSLEDSIMVLQMKTAGADQKAIDKALLERYKTRLNNLNKK